MMTRSARPVVDRAELGFVEAAQAAFSFLVEDRGFRLVRLEPPTFLRYESDTIFVNIYHGRQSYELNVEIGRIADPMGRSYRLPEVLGALFGWDDRRRTYFQASSSPVVRRCIETIADLVTRHYQQVLMGDREALDRIAAHTAEKAHMLEKEAVQRRVRGAAEKAWRAKNYAKVRELYESIRDDLSLVERKRLEYAEKHDRG